MSDLFGDYKPSERQQKCRFGHCFLHSSNGTLGTYYTKCRDNPDEDGRIVTNEDCEACQSYKSKFIEYPITINGIEYTPFNQSSLYQHDVGALCAIRPCAKEYKNKTYIGIFLGELAHSAHVALNEETGILTVSPMDNPAIFVPKLKKVIFGIESWWSIIENPDDLKDITDEMIENQWYVKLAKDLFPQESEK